MNLLLNAYTQPKQIVRSGCAASLPSAKLVFSHAMLVTPRNGVPTLIARVCNTRGNYLLNPEVCALATSESASWPARMLTRCCRNQALTAAPGRRSAWAT